MELAEEVLEAWSKNHPLTGPEHKFLLKSMNTASKMLHADQVMVACASTEEDDPFQWRFYAEDGRGYAIGLRAAWMGGMLDNSKRPRVQTVLGRPMWGRVVYSRPYQQQLVEEVIERALLEFREAEDESVRGWLVGGTAQTLADVIAHMKHEGFRGENEVRLVQSVSNTSHARFIEWMNEEGLNFDDEAEVPPVDPLAANCLRERQTSLGPIPYLALTRFPEQPRRADGSPDESPKAIDAALQLPRLWITCVRVGPRLDQDAACDDVRATLRELGYDDAEAEVDKSKVSLASLNAWP